MNVTDVRAALRIARQTSKYLGRGVKRNLEIAMEELEDESQKRNINEGTQLRLMNRIKSIYDARIVEKSLHVEEFLLEQLSVSPTLMMSMTTRARLTIDNARFWRLLIAKARKENRGEGELEEWWTLALDAFMPDWVMPRTKENGERDDGCLPMLRYGSLTLLETKWNTRSRLVARLDQLGAKPSELFPTKYPTEASYQALNAFDAIHMDHRFVRWLLKEGHGYSDSEVREIRDCEARAVALEEQTRRLVKEAREGGEPAPHVARLARPAGY